VVAYSISKCKEVTVKAPQAKQEDNAVPKSSELLGQLQKRDSPKNLIRFVREVWTINALMATVRSVQETYGFRTHYFAANNLLPLVCVAFSRLNGADLSLTFGAELRIGVLTSLHHDRLVDFVKDDSDEDRR
jgi:hypothetical protein